MVLQAIVGKILTVAVKTFLVKRGIVYITVLLSLWLIPLILSRFLLGWGAWFITPLTWVFGFIVYMIIDKLVDSLSLNLW